MQSVSTSLNFTCSFNEISRQFTVGTDGTQFSILNATGSNALNSGWDCLGYDKKDFTQALSYVSPNIFNSIQRIVAPITCYRNSTPRFQAPEDSGKIYGIDYNTMLRKYPIMQHYPSVPDKFSIVRWNTNGTIRIRLNTYPLANAFRAEMEYIPIPQDLYDNDASIPLLPRAYREYLTYAAAYYIMLDKSDNRAETYNDLAKKVLASLVNDNRSNKELSSNTFGRLIPRAVTNRPWRTLP